MPRGPSLTTPKRLTVSLDKTQFSAVDALAKQNGVSMSWLVRFAVSELLKRNREQPIRFGFPSKD
jgi:hypothetical protein